MKKNMTYQCVKPTKDINSAIIAKVNEGYPLRKAISVAELSKTKRK